MKKGAFMFLSIDDALLNKLRFSLLVLLVISLPFSVTLTDIICGLLVLYWLLFYSNKKMFLAILKENPVVLFVCLLFFSFVISLIWSDDLGRGFKVITKEKFLLFIPIFMQLIKKEERDTLIKLFVFSMVVLVFFSYMVYFGILDFIPKASKFNPTPFMTHIPYNPLLAFTIYLLIYYFFQIKQTKTKVFIAFLIIIMSVNMFITGGRAGQVAFFVLLLVAFFQFVRVNILKIIGFLIFLICIFILAYNFSPIFKNRINAAIYDIKSINENRNTSVGLRITMWENSIRIIKNNPFLGVGVGDFPNEYKKICEKHTPNAISDVSQPHNMYLFVWASNGIFSFLVLIGLFLIQLIIYFRKKDEFRPIRLALALFFIVIMFSESYLLTFHTTVLFMIFVSILYKDISWDDIKVLKKDEI